MCIVRVIKEQEEVRVMTSSFSNKGRAAVLDRSAEISRSKIVILQKAIIYVATFSLQI